MSKRTINVFATGPQLVPNSAKKSRPTLPPPPPTPKLTPERCVPRVMADVFGNDPCKRSLDTWLKNRGVTLCLLSGPTGCGKSCLARVAIQRSGREVVDLRGCDNMEAMLEDLMYTPGKNSKVGVIIDELENLATSVRTRLLKVLTKRNPTVPVISICTDPTDKTLATYAKACGTRIRMEKPTPHVARELVGSLAPTMSHIDRAEIARISNGDLRQAVILTIQTATWIRNRDTLVRYKEHVARRYQNLPGGHAKIPKIATQLGQTDRRVNDIFSATRCSFGCPRREEVFNCVSYSTLVPPMIQEHLVKRVITKNQSLEDDLAQMEDLASRLERMSSGDVLDSHNGHQTHHHASEQYVSACLGQRGTSKNPSFPESVGIPSKRTKCRTTLTDVTSLFSAHKSCHEDMDMVVSLVKHKLSRDAQCLNDVEKKVSRKVVEEFRGLKI